MPDRVVRQGWTFDGDVQGVGFRWQMMRYAREYGITGWVRNEDDGSVSAEVQGTPEKLELLMYRMQTHRYAEIRNFRITDLPVVKNESGFEPRLY